MALKKTRSPFSVESYFTEIDDGTMLSDFLRAQAAETPELQDRAPVVIPRQTDEPGIEPVTSPQSTLPVDTPPLVAVKVQSRLSQSSGPAEAAPVMVSVAPVSAPQTPVVIPERALEDERSGGAAKAGRHESAQPGHSAGRHGGAQHEAQAGTTQKS